MGQNSPPLSSPPAAMPGHEPRSTRTLGVVLAVVLLASLGAALIKLAGLWAPPDDLTPQETVERMVAALEDGDCGEARKYAWKIDDSVCAAAENGEISFGRVSEGQVVDETATVHVEVERSGEPEAVDVKVHLYWDRRWEAMDGADPDGVMHSALVIDDATVVMASDGGDAEPGHGVSVCLWGDDAAALGRAFDALSAGGTVSIPFGPSPWGSHFGQFVDRFGIPWMIEGGETAE